MKILLYFFLISIYNVIIIKSTKLRGQQKCPISGVAIPVSMTAALYKRLFLLQKPPKYRGLNLVSATVFFIGFLKRKSCDTRKKRVREYHFERK